MVFSSIPSASSAALCSSSSYSQSTTLFPIPICGRRLPRSSSLALVCRAAGHSERRSFTICLTALAFSFSGRNLLGHSSFANAAVLEADDDVELLEKVKKDRKKRLQRQEIINSSIEETGYLQEVVYKLSKVGQAIDSNDFSTASSILGSNPSTDWIQNANAAFTKLSLSPEEKTEVETFNTSISSLISSVTKSDVESSKKAFVSSASALEKWTSLTGLGAQLKGL